MRDHFALDETTITALLERAKDRSDHGALLERARQGAGLEAEEAAVLWYASRLSTEDLYAAAVEVRQKRSESLETFSPLYMTNTCDAECKMCGMRRDNRVLQRHTADLPEVEEQLDILQRRGMLAVSLLTGEYRPENRSWAIDYVNRALRAAQARGFLHVLVNVGSIDTDEYDRLFDGIERSADGSLRPKMTMCTFQEAYSREHYARFMGTNPENPRADYDRRLQNFDRAYEAGMRVANPGILVGLNPDLAFEMTALVLHAKHLLRKGMEIYLSTPRLRQIAGRHDTRGASDAEFVRMIAVLSLGLPDCKIVLTTRESAEIQRQLVPIVSVLSAGSAAVVPYTPDGARFPLDQSQFEVIDQRPFEKILADFLPTEGRIQNFQPPQ